MALGRLGGWIAAVILAAKGAGIWRECPGILVLGRIVRKVLGAPPFSSSLLALVARWNTCTLWSTRLSTSSLARSEYARGARVSAVCAAWAAPHLWCPCAGSLRQAKQLSSKPEDGTIGDASSRAPQEAEQKVRLPGCLAVPAVLARPPLSPLSPHSSWRWMTSLTPVLMWISGVTRSSV